VRARSPRSDAVVARGGLVASVVDVPRGGMVRFGEGRRSDVSRTMTLAKETLPMAQHSHDFDADWAWRAHPDWEDFGEAYAAAIGDIDVESPPVVSHEPEHPCTPKHRSRRASRLVAVVT
jgi:hypothetical protein